MLIVRAANTGDLDALMGLAREAGSGMTTFKADRGMLGRRLEIACASFGGSASAAEADYVFVLEDLHNGRVAGISAIKGAVGLDEAFYNYRLETVIHSSKELKLFTRMQTLHLSNDMTGATELCSLFLHPRYRCGANGRLLSKARLLFIAQFPELFGERVFAEMRGFQDGAGRSPFYDAVGAHFFKLPFDQADDLTACGRKSFIGELMPRQPLYAAYLPAAARAALSAVHPDTAPARRLLEQEGMYFGGLIDIFDAGPVLESRLAKLRVMRESATAPAHLRAAADDDGHARPDTLLANLERARFRALAWHADQGAGALQLPEPALRALALDPGAGVRSYRIAPSATQPLNGSAS
ncbi:MAG: arginine N-succinyltransferase [Pseudomonadota bacterium]